MGSFSSKEDEFESPEKNQTELSKADRRINEVFTTLYEKKGFTPEQISRFLDNKIRGELPENIVEKFNELFPYRLQLVIARIGDFFGILNNVGRLEDSWGNVHVGLKMGPFMIDWRNNHITNFRPISFGKEKGDRILAIIDLERIITEEDLPQLQKIMRVWNQFYSYSSLTFTAKAAEKSRSGNCHAFVNTILNVLVFQPWWSSNGVIGSFLTNVKKSGSIIKPSFKGQVFNTHDELDQYYQSNRNTLGKEEIELLKSFDRGFRFTEAIYVNTECPFISMPENEAIGPPEFYILNIYRGEDKISLDNLYNTTEPLKEFY